MKKDRLDTVYICSVSPIELREEIVMRYPKVDENHEVVTTENDEVIYENVATFLIKPCKKNEYNVIPVYDGAALIRDPTSYETGQSKLLERPQSAIKIAKSIITDLTSHDIGSPSGYQIGIDVIAGPEPTAEELARLQAQRDGWCLFLVRQADTYYNKPESRWMITDTHKAAAEALDIGNSPDHPWIRSIKPGDNKQCIACQEYIPSRALVCPKCQTNLMRFVTEAGLEMSYVKTQDTFVYDLLNKKAEVPAEQLQEKKVKSNPLGKVV